MTRKSKMFTVLVHGPIPAADHVLTVAACNKANALWVAAEWLLTESLKVRALGREPAVYQIGVISAAG